MVDPVDPDTLAAPEPDPGSLVRALRADPEALVYFLLNVGDGDTQLMLPPDSDDGVRRLIVVDVATRDKLPALLEALHGHGLIELSGTTQYLDTVRLTVIGPGVGLRTRFDTYGVGVNDASITLMVAFPATSIYTEPCDDRIDRRTVPRSGRRLLLGADAQFTSWAQTTVDFPDLAQQHNPALARELRTALGSDYLQADVFKLSHHASKNGINIELLERVAARLALVSSVAGAASTTSRTRWPWRPPARCASRPPAAVPGGAPTTSSRSSSQPSTDGSAPSSVATGRSRAH